jgi:hypothetical protein
VCQICIKLSRPFDPVLPEQFVASRHFPAYFLTNLKIVHEVFAQNSMTAPRKRQSEDKTVGLKPPRYGD